VTHRSTILVVLEARGDLWELGKNADAVVITTNGFVKKNGHAVMGRGCAREARDRWAGLDLRLGTLIRIHGNRCFRFAASLPNNEGSCLVSFPVKPERGLDGEPGWSCPAEMWLIRQSARQLVEMADKFGWGSVVLPRPGCGNGGLDWDDVRPILEAILDDRFTVVTF